MPRYRVTLAYDGTDFAGWQTQKAGSGARTVQGVVEQVLTRLADGTAPRVAGAGRTDAGVHALGQLAAFDLPRAWSPERLVRAMNSLLDHDVRVLDARIVSSDYDPRRAARRKLYRYALDVGPMQLPTRRRCAGHTRSLPNEDAVVEACRLFVGRHDFASLASAGSSVLTTVRRVVRSETRFTPTPGLDRGRTLVYEVEGEGFLRKMVRSMVGGLIEVGRDAIGVAELRRALDARDRAAWPAPAQARGLTLVWVDDHGLGEAGSTDPLG